MKAWRNERRDYPYDRDLTGSPPPFPAWVTLAATIVVIICIAVMLGGV